MICLWPCRLLHAIVISANTTWAADFAMVATPADPFQAFATAIGLLVTTEELGAAPRDVLAPPSDQDRYFLVTLALQRDAARAVRTLFVTGSNERPPNTRDVLWWLASDSWAVEEAGRNYQRWARTYRYSVDDPAGMRLFRSHADQADAARALMGEPAYRELLNLYHAEVAHQS